MNPYPPKDHMHLNGQRKRSDHRLLFPFPNYKPVCLFCILSRRTYLYKYVAQWFFGAIEFIDKILEI